MTENLSVTADAVSGAPVNGGLASMTFVLGNMNKRDLSLINGLIELFTDPLKSEQLAALRSGEAALTLQHGQVCIHPAVRRTEFSNN